VAAVLFLPGDQLRCKATHLLAADERRLEPKL
jgi:hypothetical protein